MNSQKSKNASDIHFYGTKGSNSKNVGSYSPPEVQKNNIVVNTSASKTEILTPTECKDMVSSIKLELNLESDEMAWSAFATSCQLGGVNRRTQAKSSKNCSEIGSS